MVAARETFFGAAMENFPGGARKELPSSLLF